MYTTTREIIKTWLIRCGSVFALLLAAALVCGAQVGSGSIRGSVTDSSGAAVAGAKVTLKNVQTGIVTDMVTDTDGRYTMQSLAIGEYQLQVQLQGFKTEQRNNIILQVGDQREMNITLSVGEISQSVSVDAQVAQVDTNSATVSGLIDQAQMRDLPLNGRNFEQLIMLAPGTQRVTNGDHSSFFGNSDEYAFAGVRPVGQALEIDGQDVEDFWDRGGGSAVTGTSLGVDSIAEFQVFSSDAGPQFGGSGGGINAATKGGTNSWHGSAYEFFRDSYMDARNYFDPLTGPPAFRRNQYGGTLGGPIKKDKSFFFVNFEGLQQHLGETVISTLPDAAAIAEVTNPYVLAALKAQPLPNGADNGNGTGQNTDVGTQTASENYVVGRWDYKLTPKDSIFVRYILDRANLHEPFASNSLAQYPQTNYQHNQFLVLSEQKQISSTLINQANFNYARVVQIGNITARIPAFNCNPENGYDCGILSPGISTMGIITNGAPIYFYVQNKFEPRDDIFWTKGGHAIAIGVLVERQQTESNTPVQPGGNYFFSSYGYNPSGGAPLLNSFLSGQPSSFIGALPGQADSRRDFRETDATGYIQDVWKVRPKLTLNLGLRYSFASNPIEVHNKLFAFIPSDPDFVNAPHVFQSNPSLRNFDPRLGLAWAPFKDNRTSVRVGFGIFHDVYQVRSYGVGYNFLPPFNQLTVPFPAFTVPVVFQSTVPGGTASAVLPSVHDALGYNICCTPYVIQYNFSVQRELPGRVILTAGYLGNQGNHLLAQVELNPPENSGTLQVPQFAQLVNGVLVTNPRMNPNFGSMGEIMPDGHSTFNALQLIANKAFSHGLQAQANFTYSKCLDDSSGAYSIDTFAYVAPPSPYPISHNRGNCGFNRDKVFTLNFVYSLPFHRNRFVRGWQISNILTLDGGDPFTVEDEFDSAGLQGQNSADLPNIVPGRNPGNITLHNPNEWFDQSAFTLPTPGTIGNEGRDVFTGPTLKQDDVAIMKNFSIEKYTLQFRFEAFNVFNHPNFADPNFGVFLDAAGDRDPTSGLITSTVTTSRQLQLAVKFIF
jgi:hypothetical protein